MAQVMQGNHSYLSCIAFIVRDVHVCGVFVHVYAESRRERWVSCSITLSYSLWHGFLIVPGVRLAASRLQPCVLLFLTQCHITDACGHIQFPTWVLGLRIHVLMIVQQELLPSEPSP